MIIGHEKLKELFPNFKEDIAENGIDLRIGEVMIIDTLKSIEKGTGCVNDKKMPPTYISISKENKEYYTFEPKTFYFIKIDRPIHIPHGYVQNYYLRSTFSRCGLILTDAVGDDDFEGTLMLGVYNSSTVPIRAGHNERIIQAVTIMNDGTAKSYNGSYQKDKIYKKDTQEQ